jgi:hypothetical protein
MRRLIARRGTRGALACAAALGLTAAILSGCGVPGRADADADSGAVKVTERDFRITAPKELHAGKVRLSLYNHGPDTHELIVVREDAGPLPVRPSGITVDEDGLEAVTAGELEPGPPGSERELTLHLEPGRYVLFCNMSGHYMGGMHTELVVR